MAPFLSGRRRGGLFNHKQRIVLVLEHTASSAPPLLRRRVRFARFNGTLFVAEYTIVGRGIFRASGNVGAGGCGSPPQWRRSGCGSKKMAPFLSGADEVVCSITNKELFWYLNIPPRLLHQRIFGYFLDVAATPPLLRRRVRFARFSFTYREAPMLVRAW